MGADVSLVDKCQDRRSWEQLIDNLLQRTEHLFGLEKHVIIIITSF